MPFSDLNSIMGTVFQISIAMPKPRELGSQHDYPQCAPIPDASSTTRGLGGVPSAATCGASATQRPSLPVSDQKGRLASSCRFSCSGLNEAG